MGMICDNAPFYFFVGDLIDAGEKSFRYPRLLHANPGRAGGVCLVYHEAENAFLFERIFRHGPRRVMWECPRGFHEQPELSAEENIRKELSEELDLHG